MRKPISITVLVFILLFFFISGTTAAKKFTFDLHREMPVGKNPTLFLSNISGKVIIKSHPQEKITIDALKVVKTHDLEKAEELAEKIKIEIKKDGEEVSIRTEYPRSRLLRSFSAWVNYEISVPPATELNIKTTSADVEVEEIEQKIRISTVSGDLEAQTIRGIVDFSSVSGDVLLQDTQGDLFLEGTSSDLELRRINGNVRIDCVSGDLELSGIEGDIEVSTSSGDIEVDQKQGELDLTTISGDVEVRTRISPEGEYNVATTSGDIIFYLPEDSDADLECETRSGSIHTRVALDVLSTSRDFLRGKLGSGGPRIDLSTTSGDIKVRGY
jgi:DUF4097 and DUF4098 domain-containing protein YvlB